VNIQQNACKFQNPCGVEDWWVENQIKMPYEEVGFFNQTNKYTFV
jgi:hypothetical protein